MSEWYIVQHGDCLWSIGQTHRLPWKKIWEHAKNKQLRDRRGNPNFLYPGDQVFIPDFDPREEDRATENKHRFRASGQLEVRIAVLDLYHQPIAGIQYRYIVNGLPRPEKKTAGDGLAKELLPAGASDVVLRLPWGDFPVELGGLAPARTARGLQQRLANLGIDPGGIDGIIGPKTRKAIMEFQILEAEAGLEPNGEPDEKTIKRLREVHEQQTLSGVHNILEEHAPEKGAPGEVEDVDASEVDEVDPFEAIDHPDQDPGERYAPEQEQEE